MTELLSVFETRALADREAVIERGLATFVDVGTALAEIRDDRLYRAEHGTFEDYCRERWGFDRTRAQNFITAARTVLEISNTDTPAPTVESQARELARVPAEQRADVWRETVERTEGKPTAAAIRETANPTPERVPGRLCDVPGHGIGPHRACPETMPAAEQIEQRIAEKVQPPPAWTPAETELRKRVEDGQTVVVSQRGEHARLIDWATERDLFVRVDRRTEWGNPFEMPADGDRATVILAFESHYLPHKPSLLDRLDELRGKALGCWCAPEPCHGDVLAAWADGRGEQC